MRKYGTKARLKLSRANFKSRPMSKALDGSSLPALLTSSHLCFGLVPSLSTALFGRCLLAQVPPTSGGLHHNSGFIFTASDSILSGPPYRDFSVTGLASVDLLNHGGRFQANPFTHVLFMTPRVEVTLKAEACGLCCQVCCLLVIKPVPLEPHLQ